MFNSLQILVSLNGCRPQDLIRVDRVFGLLGPHSMSRHPNLAFFGGTVIIAIMVMAAFANVAIAGDCSYSKSAEATPEQVEQKKGEESGVEA